MWVPVVAPVPPVTLVYGPPEVADTCHWFEIPASVDIPVAVKVTACPQTGATTVEEATGAGGVPEHAGAAGEVIAISSKYRYTSAAVLTKLELNRT